MKRKSATARERVVKWVECNQGTMAARRSCRRRANGGKCRVAEAVGKPRPCARPRDFETGVRAHARLSDRCRELRMRSASGMAALINRTWIEKHGASRVTRTPWRPARPTPEHNALMSSAWYPEPGVSSSELFTGVADWSSGREEPRYRFNLSAMDRMAEGSEPAIASTAVCSATPHDLSDRKPVNRLPRRSAMNLGADQQSGGACVAYRRLIDDYKMLLIRPIIIL